MDLGLQGKVVVITGGTAGFGKAFIAPFQAEGAKVVVCGRNEATNSAVQAEYPDALVVRADVGKPHDLRQLAEAAVQKFGGVDVWINNAGILTEAKLMDMSEEAWDTLMDINFKSVFTGTKVAVPYLEKRGGGVIINACSFANVIPSAGSGAYAASKAGVSALTRVFAAELAPRNIRVVDYTPGVFDTPMNQARIEKNRAQLLDPIPLRRFGLSEELAAAVVFLASKQASYMTGTTLAVTGGKFCVQNPASAW